jgi:predicted Zn-dependent protease
VIVDLTDEQLEKGGADAKPAPPPQLVRRASRQVTILIALVLAGCISFDKEKPQEAKIPLPPPRINEPETAQTSEHKRLVALFGGEYHAPACEHFLNDILAKLAPVSDNPGETYRVTILNTPVVNAFALPSGDLYVTRGLLALANDGSEVAAVMAHEIAHVAQRHASQRAELEKRSEVISKAASVIQNREKGEEVQANARLTIARFSRQQEFEADQIGVRVIAHAGYDPYGATRFLASLGRSTALRAAVLGQSTSNERLDMMATHPSTPERVQETLAAARQIAAPGIGDTAKAGYLATIDGITYGDDPSEGFIRGRRFLHPKLGFAFVAPEGFALENTARAVLGTANAGEALRLDSVRVPATTTLEEYLASGWIDGLQQGSIEPLMINGLSAATATARGGDWTFRVAVVRFGTEVYRLIFATHALTAERDQHYRASIDSFRRVPSEEIAAVRPLRIAIVTASEGDQAEALATRMAVPDRPLETFLILNGLERGGALKAGEKYKLVVE